MTVEEIAKTEKLLNKYLNDSSREEILVIGEKGRARVESIGAGGYNIQRYHIRVLVKEVR